MRVGSSENGGGNNHPGAAVAGADGSAGSVGGGATAGAITGGGAITGAGNAVAGVTSGRGDRSAAVMNRVKAVEG